MKPTLNLPNDISDHITAAYYLRQDPAIDPHTGKSIAETAGTFYGLIASGFERFFGFSSCESPPTLTCIRSYNRKCAHIESNKNAHIVLDLQMMLDMERLTKILLFARTEEPTVAFAFLYLTQRFLAIEQLSSAESMLELFSQWKSDMDVHGTDDSEIPLSWTRLFYVITHELAHFVISKEREKFSSHFANTMEVLSALKNMYSKTMPDDHYLQAVSLIDSITSPDDPLVEELICDRLSLYMCRQLLAKMFAFPMQLVSEGVLMCLCHLRTLGFLEGAYLRHYMNGDNPDELLFDRQLVWQRLRMGAYTQALWQLFYNELPDDNGKKLNDLVKRNDEIVFGPMRDNTARLFTVHHAIARQETSKNMKDPERRQKIALIEREVSQYL